MRFRYGLMRTDVALVVTALLLVIAIVFLLGGPALRRSQDGRQSVPARIDSGGEPQDILPERRGTTPLPDKLAIRTPASSSEGFNT